MANQIKLGSLFDGAGTCCFAADMCGITPVWSSGREWGTCRLYLSFRSHHRGP